MRRALVFLLAITPLIAIEAERDFSGNWILVESRSDLRTLGAEPEPFLTVTQDDRAIQCKTSQNDREVTWSYALDGTETKSGARSSRVKWEGAALLINTLLTDKPGHAVMDRWRMSSDRALLTITRQVVRMGNEVEGRLVYRRAGARVSESAPTPDAPIVPPSTPATATTREGAPTILKPRPAPVPAAPTEAVVPAGTRVPLELVNTLNTGKSRDGDQVYLRTAFPVTANDRVVIPRGSDVIGTIVAAKGSKGKRDLYIRFDTLTLPDGTSHNLRARPDGGKEGKVTGETDKGGEVRKVATGGAIGASIGGIAGAIGGRPGMGAGIGGLAGAAAGLGSVLSKRQDITLPKGTQVEMVLEREIRF